MPFLFVQNVFLGKIIVFIVRNSAELSFCDITGDAFSFGFLNIIVCPGIYNIVICDGVIVRFYVQFKGKEFRVVVGRM